jgi:hypothetical protein
MTFTDKPDDPRSSNNVFETIEDEAMTRQNTSKTGRTGNGRFQKGVSGNPGGRPKIENAAEMREALQLLAPRAIEVLGEIMDSEESAPSARLAAAQAILDRCYGKPTQAIDQSVTKGETFDEWVIRTERERTESEEAKRLAQ